MPKSDHAAMTSTRLPSKSSCIFTMEAILSIGAVVYYSSIEVPLVAVLIIASINALPSLLIAGVIYRKQLTGTFGDSFALALSSVVLFAISTMIYTSIQSSPQGAVALFLYPAGKLLIVSSILLVLGAIKLARRS